MNDAQFLEWIAARLVRYGESPNVDFIGRLCSISRSLPTEQHTPNTGLSEKQSLLLESIRDYEA